VTRSEPLHRDRARARPAVHPADQLQRYVEHFIECAEHTIAECDDFTSFVEPGDVATPNRRLSDQPASGAGRTTYL